MTHARCHSILAGVSGTSPQAFLVSLPGARQVSVHIPRTAEQGC